MSLNVESGENNLCPMMHDTHQERISSLLKVYSIVTFQLLLTIAIISIVIFVHPVANFFNNNNKHLGVLVLITFFGT
jgi:FtsH-binding integral membrane protein